MNIYSTIKLIKKKFGVPILIYFSGLVILLTIIYHEKKYTLLKTINKKLEQAIETIDYIIPPSFHDRAIDSLSISPEEDWKNIMKLTNLAKQLDVSFLYTIIIKNNKAYFTTCSTNDVELKHKTYIRYFTPYPEATSLLISMPNKKGVQFETSTDKWGTFHTAFKKKYSPEGRIYIVGADVDIKEIKDKLNDELIYLSLFGLILTLLFLPMIISILKNERKNINHLKTIIDGKTAELSKELIQHKQTLIMLQQALKEKDEFARKAKEALDSKIYLLTTISHELRTPLNVIIGLNSLLLKSPLNDEQRDYCNSIQNASQQILTIIEEAMQIYYSQPERINLQLEPFEINDLMIHLFNQYSNVIRYKNLKFNYSIDEQIPRYLIGDVSFLRQILFNLVNNAIKFTEKGEIRIEAQFEDVLDNENKVIVLFKVIDTGMGMSLEQQRRIQKALNENIFHSKSLGLGIGLTLSLHLAKMLNANLWFKSEPGKGSTFYLRVPLSIGNSSKNPLEINPVPEDAQTKSKNKKNLHILLAEDNELNIKIALKSLSSLGHKVSVAKNGHEVIHLLKKQTFDIILMDIEMPEMNGIETARFIQKNLHLLINSQIPIIALTAYAMPEIQKECEKVGIRHFVVKPINFKELNNLMLNIINNSFDS